MTAAELQAWLDLMKVTKNLSSMACARALGIDKNSMTRYRANGAPLTVALACHALAAGLGPWTPIKESPR